MKAPIHAEKHYVQQTASTVAAVSASSHVLIDAVTVSAKTTSPFEVVEGAVIKAVYIEWWAISSASFGSQVFVIGKYPSGISAPTYAQMVALNSFKNKKNILHAMQGLAGNDGVSGPMCLFKGWIKIPKSKQRFGYGDRLIVTIANPHATNDLDYCGFATYKEYT